MKPQQTRYRLGNSSAPPARGPLGALFALVASGVLLVLGLTFSLLILAAVAVIGALGLGYFWWKTRALRKHLREQLDSRADLGPATATSSDANEGNIIEGVIVSEERETSK